MAGAVTYSETSRKLVHIAAGAGVIALPWLDWRAAALLALAASVFNWLWLPRLLPGIIRASDRNRWSGLHFYPLAVLGLTFLFRARLDIVATVWAIIAAGDGLATLTGQRWHARRLPWNPAKSWAGLFGFVLAGVPAAVVAGAWVAPTVTPMPSPAFTVWVAIVAAIGAALVETIPIGLDDNVSVPVAAAATFALATTMDAHVVVAAWPLVATRLPTAIVVNSVLALAAVLARSLTLTGAGVGTLIGVAIYAGSGGAGWLILAATFALAVTSSSIGHARKAARGIAEARDGRRGAGNAIANCLVGSIGAALMVAQHDRRMGALVLVTGLAAGASDTVASEIGKAFGGAPRVLTSWRRVVPGTPGAVSLAGTLAGVAAAALMASFALLVRVPAFDSAMLPLVVIGATAGAFTESLLANWLEPSGVLNNDILNFLNTSTAAVVAVLLLR